MKFSDYNEKSNIDVADIKLDKKTEKILRRFVSGYEGKTQEEILQEIIGMAEKNRAEGKLSDKDLDDFCNMLKPMLEKEQLVQLEKIILRLKGK